MAGVCGNGGTHRHELNPGGVAYANDFYLTVEAVRVLFTPPKNARVAEICFIN